MTFTFIMMLDREKMNNVIIYMFQKHLCFLINIFLPDVKHQLFRKHSDAGKDRRQEEKKMTEDETVGWHH